MKIREAIRVAEVDLERIRLELNLWDDDSREAERLRLEHRRQEDALASLVSLENRHNEPIPSKGQHQ